MSIDEPEDSYDPKPGELVVLWGYADGNGPDICYFAGEGVPRWDQRLMHNALTGQSLQPMEAIKGNMVFDKSLLDELTDRGYDLSTLRFSIQKKTA